MAARGGAGGADSLLAPLPLPAFPDGRARRRDDRDIDRLAGKGPFRPFSGGRGKEGKAGLKGSVCAPLQKSGFRLHL